MGKPEVTFFVADARAFPSPLSNLSLNPYVNPDTTDRKIPQGTIGPLGRKRKSRPLTPLSLTEL